MKWTKNKYATSFHAMVTKDPNCLEAVWQEKGLKDNSFMLETLEDGHYYLCVFGIFGNRQVAATNNGVPLTIDKSAPIISQPGMAREHGQTFTPDLEIEDFTELRFEWSKVEGPGELTFSQSDIRNPQITADKNGLYSIKVRITDQADHSVEKTFDFVWTGSPENTTLRFLSLANSGVALDGYVNDSEKMATDGLWTLSHSSATEITYTALVDDSSGTLACNASQLYDQVAVPSAATMASDGIYAICVRLSDAAGNTVYGKSGRVVRDTVPPTFLSLSGTNAAVDNKILDAEKLLTNPIWLLSANNYDNVQYTSPLSDVSGLMVCDSSQTFNQNAIASPSSLALDTDFILCTKLSDAAGNVIYGKSTTVTRDTAAPILIAFALANA
ncbi:MAG: hypothetical protein EOO38_16605, partial [Cytophagaceae bacterium]